MYVSLFHFIYSIFSLGLNKNIKKRRRNANFITQIDALKISYENELNHYRVKADLRKWRLHNKKDVCSFF